MKRLAFALLLAASALQSFALTATVDGLTWTYTVSNGLASVGGGSNSSTAVPTTTTGAISIPTKLGGYTVTSIGDWAFVGCTELTEITIPATVTSIGNYAFGACSGITELTIPDNVTSIGDYAFYGCSAMMSVTIPNGVTHIGDYAFGGCSKLVSVTIPTGVTTVGNYVFRACSELRSVSIPNSVEHIGDSAFYGCSHLESITIPNSVTNLGQYSFGFCRMLTSITMPDGLTSIGSSAFFLCDGLTTITIPANVTNVGNWAFDECSNLKMIFIPESLASQTDSWGLPSGCRIVEGLDVTVETVRVPKAWIYERAPAALATANDDWAAAALSTAANGTNQVWECYVAGLDPTNATSRFLATLSFDGNGAPSAGWTPDLGAERVYAVEGRATLTNAWGAVGDGSRFFRVRVAMPGEATIAFDSAGGSAVTPITALVGSAVAAPAAPTKTGYAFAGWSPAFPSTMPLGGATLTAQWTPIAYAVKFNANGGDGSMANQSFVYGTAQALASNAFTRARYAFAGWATSASGAAVYANGQSVQNLSATAGDLVNLYAVWEPVVDKVYWASLAYSPAGLEDLENVRPSGEQIKQMDSQNLTDETLAAGIRMEFNMPVINGTAYTFWIFVAFPQSWVSGIRWEAAGISVTPPQPVTREIDGVLYNTYIFSGGNNYPYESGPMYIFLKK